MTVKVIVPPEVTEQIYAIGLHIAKDNVRIGLKCIDLLEARCFSLELFPERGALYGNYRRLFEGNCQIIYRIDEIDAQKIVIIVAVHHMSRRGLSL